MIERARSAWIFGQDEVVLVHEQQPSKRHSMPWPPWPAQSSCAVGADDGERVAERTDGSDASAQRGRREQLFANALADLDDLWRVLPR